MNSFVAKSAEEAAKVDSAEKGFSLVAAKPVAVGTEPTATQQPAIKLLKIPEKMFLFAKNINFFSKFSK